MSLVLVLVGASRAQEARSLLTRIEILLEQAKSLIYHWTELRGARQSDGTPLDRNTLGAAVFYNFSWGFAPF